MKKEEKKEEAVKAGFPLPRARGGCVCRGKRPTHSAGSTPRLFSARGGRQMENPDFMGVTGWEMPPLWGDQKCGIRHHGYDAQPKPQGPLRGRVAAPAAVSGDSPKGGIQPDPLWENTFARVERFVRVGTPNGTFQPFITRKMNVPILLLLAYT